MKLFVIIAALICAAPVLAKTCTSGCACGNSCISCNDTCHVGGGGGSSSSSAPSGGCCGSSEEYEAWLFAPALIGMRKLRRRS